ncbi:MAG TPA: hypothetical protein PKA55_05615 [Rhodoblastus sp.]|nr:hypothetical protein [Rhodoblastus sp.]
MTGRFTNIAFAAALSLLPTAALADGVETAAGIRTDVVSGSCAAGANCIAKFSLLSADFLIKRASCNISTSTPGQFTGVELGYTNIDGSVWSLGRQIIDTMYSYYVDTAVHDSRYQFSSEADYGVLKGRRPAIRLNLQYSTAMTYVCVIAGLAK